MIYVVSLTWSAQPLERLQGSMGGALDRRMTRITYEELFLRRRGPIGHYIFTDLDRLTRYELDELGAFARAMERVEPAARILNDPARIVIERTSLLRRLHEAGINDFTASRLPDGERPPRYPVFIRAADAHLGPETGLIPDERAFEQAIADMEARGVPLAGRIAVGATLERSPDGFFRKYGVFTIGGRIIPQHVMRGDSWIVKSRWHQPSDDAAEEELRFVRENPHHDLMMRVCRIAGVDFGRIDYGIVGGRPQVYEINTNPKFPRFEKSDARSERRALIRRAIIEALREIDRPLGRRGFVTFERPRPVVHPPGFPVSIAGLPLLRHAMVFLWNRMLDKRAGHDR